MKYVCTGRVQPERADVTFTSVRLETKNGGSALISCDSSQLTVALDDPSVENAAYAHILAEEIGSICVGVAGFVLGSSYRTEVVQVVDAEGVPHVFGVRPRGGDDERQTLAVEPAQYDAILRLSLQDAYFRISVRDYLRAMVEVRDCAFYCYRAIEGIRSTFVGRDKAEAWLTMHAALGTDAEKIGQRIKKLADPARHGNWGETVPIDATGRWEMLWITRDALLRYLSYRTERICDLKV